ncbi:MAG: ABC transporter permease, partial [Gemmatimonadetes bacterium]|nr:ABC transporter permease [Gemmatimonadota bacterium]
MPEPGSLFDLVAKTFPSGFRAHHGQEMKHAFLSAAESVREKQGRLAAFQYSVRALGDALRNGLRERRRERRSGRFSPGPGPVGFQRTPLPGGSGVLSELGSDLRYSLRRLAHAPGFTLAAIVVLAFGIGANSTIFSALKTAILAEPPYPEPERLVLPAVVSAGRVDPGIRLDSWSYPKYQLLEAFPNRLIDPVAAYSLARPTLIGAGDPIRVDAEVVSPDYFRLLGASALVGRTFAPDENDPNAPPLVAVLGHGLWQTRFGRNPSAIGRQISIDGHSVTVVGVMPRGFKGLTGFGEIWIPIAATGHLMGEWRIVGPEAHWFHVLGRIPPEVRIEDAQAQMSMVAEAVEETHLDPDGNRYEYAGELMPLRAAAVNEVARTSILVLAAAAALVLLIACANVSNMMLARASSRSRELNIRTAIGAGRGRVVRQLLVESLLLFLVGGALGLLLAYAALEFFMSQWAFLLPRSEEIHLNAPVLLFTTGISLAAGLLAGLFPSFAARGSNLADSLRESTRSIAGAASRRWVRGGLVVAEVALAVVLLVGAGLLVKSLAALQEVNPGFELEDRLLFTTQLPTSKYETASSQLAFADAALERLQAIPGVETAAVSTITPLGGGETWWGVVFEGRLDLGAAENPDALYTRAS